MDLKKLYYPYAPKQSQPPSEKVFGPLKTYQKHLPKKYLDVLGVLGHISTSFSSTTKSTRIKKHVDYSLATKQKLALRNFAAIKVGETLMFLGGSLM